MKVKPYSHENNSESVVIGRQQWGPPWRCWPYSWVW